MRSEATRQPAHAAVCRSSCPACRVRQARQVRLVWQARWGKVAATPVGHLLSRALERCVAGQRATVPLHPLLAQEVARVGSALRRRLMANKSQRP